MLCLAFFAQHSGMIRQGFQRRLARVVAPHLHAALDALISGAVLMALLVFWQASDGSLISLPRVLRWLDGVDGRRHAVRRKGSGESPW